MTNLPASAPLRQLPAWKQLEAHFQKLKSLHLKQLFAQDAKRGEKFALEAAGIYLDYSKNRITDETLSLLLQLAQQSGLRAHIDAMFRGDAINVSENAPHSIRRCERRETQQSCTRGKMSFQTFMLCSIACQIFLIVCAAATGKAIPVNVFAM